MVQITIEPSQNQQRGPDRVGEIYADFSPEPRAPYNLVIYDNQSGASGDADSFGNAIDGALDAVQTLDNLREAIISDVGEMNPTQTKLCQITMESVRSRLGLTDIPRVSLESIATRQTALEGLGSLLKTIWQAIFNTLKAIWEAIQSLFGKSRKEKTAAAIKSIEKIAGDKWFQPVMIDQNNLLHPWWYIGTEISMNDMVKSILDVETFCHKFEQLINVVERIYSDLPGEIKEVTNKPEKLDDYLERTKRTLNSVVNLAFDKKESLGNYDESEDMSIAQSEVYAARPLSSGRVPVVFYTDSESSIYGFVMEGLHLKSQGTYETKHSLTVDNPFYFEKYAKTVGRVEDTVDKLMSAFQKLMGTALKQETAVMRLVNRSDVTNDEGVLRANRVLASSFRELTSIVTKIQKICLWVDNANLEHSSFVIRVSELVAKNLAEARHRDELRVQTA